MNHFYTMAGFPKPKGEALTRVALTYNYRRVWWRGERLPWVGDWLFDRRLVGELTDRICGPRLRSLSWRWVGAGVLCVLATAWAIAAVVDIRRMRASAPAGDDFRLDGGAR